MNNITLNIGLNVSKNYLPEGVAWTQLQYEYVKEQLEKALGKPMQILVAQSATEQTVVVQYKRVESVLHNLYRIAHELQQDCIAYTIQDDDANVLGGALVGRYAHEWNFGIFNEEYFLPMQPDTRPVHEAQQLVSRINLELTFK